MRQLVFLCGASDPEMAAIKRYVASQGHVAIDAVDGTGQPVSPRTAYEAADPGVPIDFVVECRCPTGTGPRVVIDHHAPGDPGYGRPPGEFMRASSIGQVIEALNAWFIEWYAGHWEMRLPYGNSRIIPRDLVLTAAADHCLGAAYRGECPGVDPDELMRWRCRSRAEFQRQPDETIEAAEARLLADVASTTEALRCAPRLRIDGPEFAEHTYDHDWSRSVCEGCTHHDVTFAWDMRREPPWPELPEAACRADLPYISGPTDRDGRRKITCSGRSYVIRAFLEAWAPREGLTDLYGDPARGFAGGYLP